MTPRRTHQGFTLIELAVVILILGIALAVAYPKLNLSAVGQAKRNKVANQVANVATYAREQAAASRETYLLHCDKNTGAFWISGPARSDSHTRPVPRFYHGKLPEGFKFQDFLFPTAGQEAKTTYVIRFSPEGWADPVTIRIADPSGQMVDVQIEFLSGRAKVGPYPSGSSRN